MIVAFLLAAAAPTFDPLHFFAGRTRGDGQLKVILHRRVAVSVMGDGKLQPDGSLLLDQLVREGAKPTRSRRWTLRRTSANRYKGALTDASGPVVAEVQGPRLHLRFTTPSGFAVQQWLTLKPGGRAADNLLVARRFGITVATLHERIVRLE